MGLGGSHSWGRLTLCGEVSGNTAFKDFGGSHRAKGMIGLRIGF